MQGVVNLANTQNLQGCELFRGTQLQGANLRIVSNCKEQISTKAQLQGVISTSLA